MRPQSRSLRRLRALRIASGALGLSLFAGAWATSAAAQEDTPERVVLRAVDATDTDAVTLIYGWSGDPDVATNAEIFENGDDVSAVIGTAADAQWSNDIVFVVDTSATTDANAMLTNAEAAVSEWLTSLPPGANASVIVAGTETDRLVGLTADPGRLAQAADTLGEMAPTGEGAVLAALVRAGVSLEAAGDTRDLIPTVVLFTDGVSDSPVGSDRAQGALVAGGSALYVVGLQSGRLDEALFAGMAGASGGRIVVTDDPGEISTLVEEIRPEIDQQFAATWDSPEDAGVQDLAMRVDDSQAVGSYISGSKILGAQELEPRPAVEASGISFFHSTLGKWIGFIAAAAACLLLAYGLVLLFVRDDSLTTQLRPYGEGYVADPEGFDEVEEPSGAGLSQTAFLQRAVAMTEGFAERQGFLVRVERMLEKADLPLRAGEAIFFYFSGVVLLTVVTLAVTQNLAGTLIVVVFGVLVPPSVLSFLANRKKKQFESLLPDTLQLLSSTLRAGYSMMQGVEAVSQEAAEPMGKELRRVVTEARLGRPLEESLEAVALRMESADFAWAVMAIRIQREVGGNLAELLLTVAETMQERERLRRDINALTAEGRMSAYVLIALPVGMLLFLYTANRDYMQPLFDKALGQVLLAVATLFMIGGYIWMRKIIKIEV